MFLNSIAKQLDQNFADEFCRLRIALLTELGELSSNSDCTELNTATKEYYLSHIKKDLMSWGIFNNGNLVAIGSLCLFSRIPYQENLIGSEGYILNIYTMPSHRKLGYAKRIVDEIIRYSSENHINRLWLNASKQGREMYKKFGFKEKENEMELFLSPTSLNG